MFFNEFTLAFPEGFHSRTADLMCLQGCVKMLQVSLDNMPCGKVKLPN